MRSSQADKNNEADEADGAETNKISVLQELRNGTGSLEERLAKLDIDPKRYKTFVARLSIIPRTSMLTMHAVWKRWSGLLKKKTND